ncbi:MAG: diaminobutyrate--2-oxoglutarate transaminase [Acidimicrobiales bacterium]|nr:diaminobutyrate--2-oxoglutarate transaminase [Acidimicrobiales bacterium]
MQTHAFEALESNVRSYCRGWPTVFATAAGSELVDEDGRTYLDFFAGAGTLNYGHNNPVVIEPLIQYLRDGGVLHSLDMHTVAKRNLLETIDDVILRPRGLDYRVMFPGPTGTNAVEAALKLARKVTGREHVISFTNAFHGMTLGSLSVTGNSMKRSGAGVPLHFGTSMPYCNYLDEGSSLHVLEMLLADSGSGLDESAAVIVETVQGEGGINVATAGWLQQLELLCREHDMLLIVDDIQMGIGRTGPFFSFEAMGITPDIVTVSKSLSGSGLPLALTLFRPELDAWEPGEHNGTFRGNNAAFVTSAAAIDHFWRDDELQREVARKGELVERWLTAIAGAHPAAGADVRGRGMVWGLTLADPAVASAICTAAFDRQLLVETSGPEGEVVKVMPPLVIDDAKLGEGLDRLADAVDEVLGRDEVSAEVLR